MSVPALVLLLAQLFAPSVPTLWHAPAGHEHVVPKLSARTTRTFSNLRYEGNNRALRAETAPSAPCADAERTRALASRTAGLFLLRDALFSQQDHPTTRPACALMLPPNWVSVAVHDAMADRVTQPVMAPDLEDDTAWAALETPAALFGGFPTSDALHHWATRERAGATDEARARTLHARTAVRTLAAAAEQMRSASAKGAPAVARVGAELIAASDRAYFTDPVRRDHVIPLFVEHPSEHEIIDEGKGLVVHGRELSPAAIELTRREVYRRRLLDGPMAIERYDITRESDVRRAIEVLEMLVPTGSTGHRVYVWVGGPLIAGTERVLDVHDRVPSFVDALGRADIELDRVTVFARPVFQSRGHDRDDLIPAIDRARAQGVLYGVNMNTSALRAMMGWPRTRGADGPTLDSTTAPPNP